VCGYLAAFFAFFAFSFSALTRSFSASSLASSCALSFRPRRLRAIYNGDQRAPRGMRS
jgi:hypothetical protein